MIKHTAHSLLPARQPAARMLVLPSSALVVDLLAATLLSVVVVSILLSVLLT
ncbi:MAG: hypothetical protein OXT73_07585 [Bacteroidota bacterium]|nr:hypothetical protein [Bacteroidota bacterium]